ncbi:hypothetical protein OC844_005209 [Tilletia horrida]|nr:hypothetical protein OC844_005209 [Tilletia horrida]
MATTTELQDGPPLQDTDDARDDSDDACSISSDPDRPSRESASELPWHYFRDLPEADALRPQIERMQPALRQASALVRDSIADLMMFGHLALRIRLLRREATSLCTRVLDFYEQLLKAGLASASSESSAPVSPGTVIHLVLKMLAIRLASLRSRLVNSLHRFDKMPIVRDFVHLRIALRRIRSAQTDIKSLTTNARHALGLVSKPYRLAFDFLYRPDTHPFAHGALRSIFYDQLGSLPSAFRLKNSEFDRKPRFPNAHFYSRLLYCISKMYIGQSYPPKKAKSDAEQDDSSVSDDSHSGQYAQADQQSSDEDGDSDQMESEDDDYIITPADYLKSIVLETMPGRLAFANMEELDLWRRVAFLRARTLAMQQDMGSDLLNQRNPHQLLAMLIIDTCKMVCFDHAAIFAELFVIHYRFQLAQEPGNDFKKADLCMALALLSVVLSRCKDRRLEGVKAIEEAQSVFSAPKDARVHAGQFEAMRASFAVLHGHALFHKSQNEGIGHRSLQDVRKAFRSARTGLEGLQASYEKRPTSKMLLAAVGRAAHSAATIGLGLLKVTEGQQDAHMLCIKELKLEVPKPKFRQKRPYPPFLLYKGWCADSLEPAEKIYVHAKVGDFSLGTVEDFAQLAGIAVDTYRELVAPEEPEQGDRLFRSEWRLYEALLAQALQLRAELLDLRPAEAIPCAEEAVEIYSRLDEAFPDHFNDRLARLYRDLARHLYMENDMPKACTAFAQAIEWRTIESDDGLGARVLVELRTTRAMTFLHLERYDDVLLELDAATQAINQAEDERGTLQSGADGNSEFSVERTKIKALRAFRLWMTGEGHAEQALAELEEVEDVLDGRATMRDYHGECAMQMRDPDAILFLGWLGSVRAATGNAEKARQQVEEAVRQARELDAFKFADDKDGIAGELVVKEALVPLPRVLAHLLVLLAAICAQLGANENAMERVEEALALSGEDYTACDPSTLKTALMLRRRLRGPEADPEEETGTKVVLAAGGNDVGAAEAEAAEGEQDGPALRGFLAQLGGHLASRRGMCD